MHLLHFFSLILYSYTVMNNVIPAFSTPVDVHSRLNSPKRRDLLQVGWNQDFLQDLCKLLEQKREVFGTTCTDMAIVAISNDQALMIGYFEYSKPLIFVDKIDPFEIVVITNGLCKKEILTTDKEEGSGTYKSMSDEECEEVWRKISHLEKKYKTSLPVRIKPISDQNSLPLEINPKSDLTCLPAEINTKSDQTSLQADINPKSVKHSLRGVGIVHLQSGQTTRN